MTWKEFYKLPYLPVIGFCVLIALALIAVAVLLWRRKRRYKPLADTLTALGFQDRSDEHAETIDFSVTLQWPEARGIQYLNRFVKEDGGLVVKVVNMRSFEITGVRAAALAPMKFDEIEQTMISFEHRGVEFPRFSMCPHDFEDLFRCLVEGGEQFVSGDAAFDGAFYVVGPEAEPLRSVFTAENRAALLEHPKTCVEAGKHCLLVYRQGTVLGPEDLKRCIGLAGRLTETIIAGSSGG